MSRREAPAVVIDGWHVEDEEHYRYLTRQPPPRPGALWQQLQVDARSWKPLAWWLVSALVLGTGIATSNWQRAAKGALMLCVYLWMLRGTARMWSNSRLVVGRLAALRPHPLVASARTASAIIEDSGGHWLVDVVVDAQPAESLLQAEGGLEVLVLIPPRSSPRYFPTLGVRPAALPSPIHAPVLPKHGPKELRAVVVFGLMLLLTHFLPGAPSPEPIAMPGPNLFQVVPDWLPIVRALSEKGVNSPGALVLTLTYSEIELASGEHIYGRIPRGIATVAEAQGLPQEQVAEAVVTSALDAESAGRLVDQVRAAQPLLAGLPGIKAVGALKLPPPAKVSRTLVDFAHTNGIRLPRTSKPSTGWQRLLTALSKEGFEDPAVQLLVVRFNKVTLSSGETLDALGDDAAYETIADLQGLDAAGLRVTTMNALAMSVDGARARLTRSKEAAGALARLPGVSKVEEVRPALPPPEVKPYHPGDPLLAPPWKRFPEPPTSLRWRMGPGEDYMDQWWPFWRGLSPEQRRAYLQQNPPPPEWEEWADRAQGEGS